MCCRRFHLLNRVLCYPRLCLCRRYGFACFHLSSRYEFVRFHSCRRCKFARVPHFRLSSGYKLARSHVVLLRTWFSSHTFFHIHTFTQFFCVFDVWKLLSFLHLWMFIWSRLRRRWAFQLGTNSIHSYKSLRREICLSGMKVILWWRFWSSKKTVCNASRWWSDGWWLLPYWGN